MLAKSKVKYIQSLGHKKSRDADAVFIAEGPKIVRELLGEDRAQIAEVFAVKEWIEANEKLLINHHVDEITDEELNKLSQLTTPNQVLVIVKKFDEITSIHTKEKITLVLDNIQDPGNLGTIIRLADWFGIGQMVCSIGCSDIYNPKVVQASMGSIARVKAMNTELEQWLKEQEDVAIYATALDGKDVTAMNKIQEGIIIIGNESKGIQQGILKLANTKITIPKKGKAESLNAAMAAGIVLSHLC